MAGQPFAANPLNKTTYPFQWLVIFFPPALHLNILIVAHLFFAGSGMWVWARSLGLRTEAVALSTLAYVLAPRVMGHMGAGHLDVFYALAWWPWLMWSARQMAGGGSHSAASILQTGLFAALVLLADVRVGLFAFGSAAIYALIELARDHSWERLGWYVIAGGIFAILTASLFVPLVLWQPYISRANLSPSDAGVLALEPIHLLGLILPAHRPSIETLTYMGLPVLVLGFMGIASFPRRARIGWLAALLFSALYAMGENAPLWPLLVKLVPGLLWFRVPSKAWLLLTLLMPLLAGYGLQWLLDQVEEGRNLPRLNLAIVGMMGVTIACGIFALAVLRLPTTMGISALVGGLLLGGLLLPALNHRLAAERLALLLLALTFLDLVWTDYQWADWRGENIWLDPGRPLAERLVVAGADRIYSPTYSLEQQVAEAYHLRMFGGIDPFQLAGVVQGIAKGSGVAVTKYDPVLPPLGGAEGDQDVALANQDAVIDAQTLAEWNVSHVVAAYPIDNPDLQLLGTVNGVYIYANPEYRARAQNAPIPDWPEGWPQLPDPATVGRFNQTTLTTALISGAGFFVAMTLLILIKLRERRA
jgi:hypothetical protein